MPPNNYRFMTRNYSADQFALLGQLGRGSFGIVYKALDKITNQIVAIKQIDLESSDEDINEIQKEITILSTCRFPQIIKYYGCYVNSYKLSIIMEIVNGGSCLDLLVKVNCFKENQIAIICRELLKALYYLHLNNKIHRDIKAANILIDGDNGDVKIVDFGVATQLSNNLSKRNTFVGTPFWMSPEVILQHDYNYKTDIWSLGITAIELALGKPPLANIHPLKVLFLIPQQPAPGLPSKNPHTGEVYSKNFINFVKMCLQKNPASRPTAKQLLNHPFIKNAGKNSDLLEIIYLKQKIEAKNKPKTTKATNQNNVVSEKELDDEPLIKFTKNSTDDDDDNFTSLDDYGDSPSPHRSSNITSQITFDFDDLRISENEESTIKDKHILDSKNYSIYNTNDNNGNNATSLPQLIIPKQSRSQIHAHGHISPTSKSSSSYSSPSPPNSLISSNSQHMLNQNQMQFQNQNQSQSRSRSHSRNISPISLTSVEMSPNKPSKAVAFTSSATASDFKKLSLKDNNSNSNSNDRLGSESPQKMRQFTRRNSSAELLAHANTNANANSAHNRQNYHHNHQRTNSKSNKKYSHGHSKSNSQLHSSQQQQQQQQQHRMPKSSSHFCLSSVALEASSSFLQSQLQSSQLSSAFSASSSSSSSATSQVSSSSSMYASEVGTGAATGAKFGTNCTTSNDNAEKVVKQQQQQQQRHRLPKSKSQMISPNYKPNFDITNHNIGNYTNIESYANNNIQNHNNGNINMVLRLHLPLPKLPGHVNHHNHLNTSFNNLKNNSNSSGLNNSKVSLFDFEIKDEFRSSTGSNGSRVSQVSQASSPTKRIDHYSYQNHNKSHNRGHSRGHSRGKSQGNSHADVHVDAHLFNLPGTATPAMSAMPTAKNDININNNSSLLFANAATTSATAPQQGTPFEEFNQNVQDKTKLQFAGALNQSLANLNLTNNINTNGEDDKTATLAKFRKLNQYLVLDFNQPGEFAMLLGFFKDAMLIIHKDYETAQEEQSNGKKDYEDDENDNTNNDDDITVDPRVDLFKKVMPEAIVQKINSISGSGFSADTSSNSSRKKIKKQRRPKDDVEELLLSRWAEGVLERWND